MREYTLLSAASVAGVVALDRFWRTGLLRRPAYWVTLAISAFFMVLVNGWLTKLSAPIVLYEPRRFSGVRFPFDIPVEDYGFGFSLITLALSCWERAGMKVEGRRYPRR